LIDLPGRNLVCSVVFGFLAYDLKDFRLRGGEFDIIIPEIADS
jgi:hypothetical protein